MGRFFRIPRRSVFDSSNATEASLVKNGKQYSVPLDPEFSLSHELSSASISSLLFGTAVDDHSTCSISSQDSESTRKSHRRNRSKKGHRAIASCGRIDFAAAHTGEPKRHRKAVSFGCMEIREYNITIGDHPMCNMGLPISLDWDYEALMQVPVDQYEACRQPPRSRREIRIPSDERRKKLSVGFSEHELKHAERNLNRERTFKAMQKKEETNEFFS